MSAVEVGDCVKGLEFVDVCLLWIGNTDVGAGGAAGGPHWSLVAGVETALAF